MTLPSHPLAEIFPLMEGEAFASLVASIEANGLREAITLHDGQVLDGRNRERACEAANVEARYELLPDGADPMAFVIDRNLKRRHLNESQRAFVAVNLATLKLGRPKETAPIGAVSQSEAAERLNVSRRSVQRAAVVRDKGSDDLKKAVARGHIAVDAAAKAAELAPETQAKVVAAAAAGKANVVSLIVKQETRGKREERLAQKQRALPNKKFGLVYADPEWDRSVYSNETGMNRHAANHYPVSSDAAIMARDVASIAAPDCVLCLWCTDPHRGVDVLRAWGFEPKSYFVWVKDIVELSLTLEQRTVMGEGRFFQAVGSPGMGFWNRDRDEILLIGTRGTVPCPAPGSQGESVWFAERPRDAAGKIIHSAKPECALEWIERHFPNLPKIELNRRGPARAGWSAWGNEAETEEDQREGALA